jgi:putative NADH-flavin reductase
MTTLVVGASGATGRHLVEQLLNRGQKVKIVVRQSETLPIIFKNNDNLSIIQASILDLSDPEIVEHVKGCDAVASCLGHNMSLKGIFGHPRRLVTDTTRRLCSAIKVNNAENPVKFVLMNTIANSNRDLSEPVIFKEKLFTVLLRLLMPPHVDNEKAADYLRIKIGKNDSTIGWTAVRPSALIDEGAVTEYDVYATRTGKAIFNSGKISRINVGHFMADLITEDHIWNKWKGQMPVIYNKASSSK